jgi:hypothetical protein
MTKPCSKAGKHWRWTRTLQSLIMRLARRSRKSTCMMKQSQRFSERSRFPDTVGHSTPISPTFTPSPERKDEAIKIVKDLEAQHDQNPAADANVALIYVGLGDHDQAMIWLNNAYEARFNPSILLRPGFDPLRSDARFKDLRRRIGLPP